MTYELAKELKEAGFQQREWGEGDFVLCQHNNGQIHEFDETCEVIVIPTLSELIEACGENIVMIVFLHDMNKCEACSNTMKAIGTTPEEAVSRLWLALNRVDNPT